MNKITLRQRMVEVLKNMSVNEKKAIEEKLIVHTLSSKCWNESNVIGITISQEFEWDTRPLIEAAWEQGKKVVIPKCYPEEKELLFYKLVSYVQLESVYMNLLEPIEAETELTKKDTIDLIIVPGLLYDYNGYRIGFGGGYYDRFLSDYPNKTLSLASQIQLMEKLPHDSYDIPVDHLITENGLKR